MAIDVAPWLLRDYDPVGTYLKAFQTGASISAEQTRLAEQQRQANMDYMAKQEAMQQNILKAQVELQMEKSYREQRMSLENAQLEETKRRNTMVAAQAAQDVMERAAYHQAINQRQEQENLAKLTSQKSFADEYKKAKDEGADDREAYRRALLASPGMASATTVAPLASEGKTDQSLRNLLTRNQLEEALRKKHEAEKVLTNPMSREGDKVQATKMISDANKEYTLVAQGITNAMPTIAAQDPLVPVYNPQGEAVKIKASKLEAALKQGYKRR